MRAVYSIKNEMIKSEIIADKKKKVLLIKFLNKALKDFPFNIKTNKTKMIDNSKHRNITLVLPFKIKDKIPHNALGINLVSDWYDKWCSKAFTINDIGAIQIYMPKILNETTIAISFTPFRPW